MNSISIGLDRYTITNSPNVYFKNSYTKPPIDVSNLNASFIL
jgi:hypothetical protein